MTETPRPPRLARALASRCLPAEMREIVIGDLDEEFASRVAQGQSRRSAARRYWRQALASIAAGQRRGGTAAMAMTPAAPASRSAAADGLLLDLRHAIRVLLRTPGFTTVAVLSLAIGIGANAAIFSVIRALLLDDMAVRVPGELSFVQWHQAGRYGFNGLYQSGDSNYSYPMYEELRALSTSDVQIAGFNFLRDVVVQYADQPARLAGGLLVDGDFFSVLSPPMALGRPLGRADNVAGGPPNVVLSHAFWRRAFGGDPSVIGRAVRINGLTAQIVGVTAARFRGLTRGGFFPQTDVTVPLLAAYRFYPGASAPDVSLLTDGRYLWVRAIARVAAGADAAPTLQRIAAMIPPRTVEYRRDKSDAAAEPVTVYLLPASRGLDQTRPETKNLLYLLMGVVGLILLIACVNLASLMLARGVARQREMAVKRALGAGRARLVRGLLLEGLIVAIAGGSAGLLLTYWSRQALTTMLTSGIGSTPLSAQPIEVVVDPALVAATFGVSVVAAVLFSLLPALRLAGSSDAAHMKHQAAGAAPKLTLGRLLVAIQIAVSVPLVVGAILFLRTIANLGGVELGFNPEGIAFFRADPSKIVDAPEQQAFMYQQILDRVQQLPGVTSASLVENVLMSGITSNTSARIGGQERSFSMNAVGPGFLETMGMRLIAGRAPGVQDVPGAPAVAAINETAARAYFGATSPIGQVMTVSRGRQIEIVGVVSDSVYERQRAEVKPTFFDSALQRPGFGGHSIVFRTTTPIDRIEPLLRQAVASVHRDLPVPEIKTQVAQLRESTMRERVFTGVLTLFGGFALLLASIGLHGVTSYAVARRTSEMGIRLALGAQRRQVLWLVQRQVVLLGVAGLIIGVPLALLLAPLAGSLLFGVAPTDYRVIVLAAAVMLFVAAGAGLLPARRAARMDPIKALRTE